MPSKRALLWDWTLTRDYNESPAIKETINSFQEHGLLTTVVNWNSWRPTELPSFFHFRPMVRTVDQLEGNEWNMINDNIVAELGRPGGHEVLLLGFNEPERASLSPEKAAELWSTKLAPLKKQHGDRLKLVSPACASDPAGTKWLQDFFKLLGAEEKPEYIGAHFYTSESRPASEEIAAAKGYLVGLSAKFGLPLVVSEIASTCRDADEVEKFSHEIANWLDEQEWIREYAFFGVMREVADGFVSPYAQLLDKEGHWTKLGKWWVGI